MGIAVADGSTAFLLDQSFWLGVVGAGFLSGFKIPGFAAWQVATLVR
jgi:hypothetical protein